MFSSIKRLVEPANVRFSSLLGRLGPVAESQKVATRVGRGPQSGHGKTSGRGHKGRKARGTVHPWFEGGQTPFFKLFPKRGFNNNNAREYVKVSLGRIQELHDKGMLKLLDGVLDMRAMRVLGVFSGRVKDGVKVMGFGTLDKEYTVPVPVEASQATPRAIEAIEKAGGSFTAKYFARIPYRAHLSPGWFKLRYGSLPNEALPTRKKDIQYYGNAERRGYLVGGEYMAEIEAKREEKRGRGNASGRKMGRLEELLVQASDAPVKATNKVMKFADFAK